MRDNTHEKWHFKTSMWKVCAAAWGEANSVFGIPRALTTQQK